MIIASMGYSTEKSKDLFQRTKKSLIEGGSSASRGPATFGSYPLFMNHGKGAWLFDVDGNSYVDWMMAYGALPLGHAHPAILAAVQEGAEGGLHFASATHIEIEVAELIQEMVPNGRKVRFANTGTEAVMAAIRLARGVTGKPKIVKFEGHYHGWYDDVLVSSNPQSLASLGHENDPIRIPDSSGLNRRALEDTIVVPWNNLEALERVLNTYRGKISAVLTEGVMANMGVIPPAKGFLKGLRKLTEQQDILLIMDETVTGFRVAAGGCQELYDVDPDLSTFGKALGCGLPVAALVGREDVMQGLKWGGVLHYGTQNASRLGLFVARASLKELNREEGAAFKHTWRIGEEVTRRLSDLFRETGTRAIVQGVGPMFQIMFTDQPMISDFRSFCAHVDRQKYQRFVQVLFKQGVYMSPMATLHSVVSLSHGEKEVELTIKAARKALEYVQ